MGGHGVIMSDAGANLEVDNAMVTSNEFQRHLVFEDLASFMEFYEFLADHTFTASATGTMAIFSMDSQVFSSMQGTLDSIRILLRTGMINDAIALVRKYHDSAVINAYTGQYIEDHIKLGQFIVERIEGWRGGKMKLPRFEKMLDYLNKSDPLKQVNVALNADDRYQRLRQRCNDHVHYNYYAHMLLNIKELHFEGRINVLDQLQRDLRDILVLHLAYVFTINFTYMGSIDYLAALECGLEPVSGSQYWVARYVQEMFDKFITPWRPDVTAAIKAGSVMELN